MKSIFIGPGIAKLLRLTAALYFVTTGVTAQDNVQTYEFGPGDKYGPKNYSVQEIGNTQECGMAGSVLEITASGSMKWKIHYQKVGSSGDLINSVVYDFGDFFDERVVALIKGPNTDFFIICQARGYSPLGDLIKVMHIQEDGTLINEFHIKTDKADEFGLYPIHAIFQNDVIYVCGYAVRNFSPGIDKAPDFQDPKYAFVLMSKIDGSLISGKFFDYSFTPSSYFGAYDYDIAMRLIPSGSSGDIFMTGSNNVITNTSSSPIYPSGVMNVLLDANLNVLHNKPFVGNNDYGIGIVEGKNGEKYIIGNTFRTESSGGMFPFPREFWITAVDQFYDHSTAVRTRVQTQLEYAWSLSSLESSFPAVGTHGVDVTISGYHNRTIGAALNCNPPYPPTMANVNPFLFNTSVTCDFASDITYAYNSFTTYMNQAGTGATSDPSRFVTMGGSLSNVAWHSVFATKLSNDEVAMYAPRTPKQFKYIHTLSKGWNYGVINNCFGSSYEWFNTCLPKQHVQYVMDPDLTAQGISLVKTVFNTDFIATNINSNAIYPPLLADNCIGSGVFRQALSVSSENTEEYKLNMSPNPANDFITISAVGVHNKGRILEVQVLNTQGQYIATICKQEMDSSIGKKLVLPKLVPGLYFVNMIVDNKSINKQKLVIQ